jgi:hypothetical protein
LKKKWKFWLLLKRAPQDNVIFRNRERLNIIVSFVNNHLYLIQRIIKLTLWLQTVIYLLDKILLIARNQLITPIDELYFDWFFRLTRIYANLCCDKDKETVTEEFKQLLYSHVFEYNSKKIIKRFVGKDDKMITDLREMIQWDKDQRSHFIQELRSNQDKYRQKPFMTEKLYLLGRKRAKNNMSNFYSKNSMHS